MSKIILQWLLTINKKYYILNLSKEKIMFILINNNNNNNLNAYNMGFIFVVENN